MRTLRFYFDYLSPYAYLAWTQIHALASRYGCDVEAVPILFAALLNHHGQKGPAEIPAKRLYVIKDASRSAHVLGVPIAAPASHPFNPLLALRVSSLQMPEGERRALISNLFAATWAQSRDVANREVVAEVARETGLDGQALVILAGRPEAKGHLRQQTEAAIALGVFGVPTVAVEGELFWGLDSLGHLERFLSGDDPLKGAHVEWPDIRPSAERSAR